MDTTDFRKMAEEIQAEIASLEIQQEATERRLARLKQALLGLVPLADESPRLGSVGAAMSGQSLLIENEALNITDATRQIFQAATIPLAPTEIKQHLLNMGKDLSSQKNVMASIHSLLKRLVSSGEIETKDNGLTYQWKGIRRFPRVDQNAKAEAIRASKVAAGRNYNRSHKLTLSSATSLSMDPTPPTLGDVPVRKK